MLLLHLHLVVTVGVVFRLRMMSLWVEIAYSFGVIKMMMMMSALVVVGGGWGGLGGRKEGC